MSQLSYRRRLANLEAGFGNPEAEKLSHQLTAWAVKMMFGLGNHKPQRRRESRDAYEARTFGVTTRQWKAVCNWAGPDFVQYRDALRKIDEKPGDRDHAKAVWDELFERQ